MRPLVLTRLSESLRHLRTQRGLTQAQLAQIAGMTRKMVVQIEQGRSTVAVGSYVALAEALGAELTVVPVRRPTLDEVRKMLADE